MSVIEALICRYCFKPVDQHYRYGEQFMCPTSFGFAICGVPDPQFVLSLVQRGEFVERRKPGSKP